MSCHPPSRQVGPYQSEDGPHDELTEQLALTDLHVKPYAQRHMKVYADTGDPRQAADIYAAIGSRPDEAYARLEAARQLIVAGHAIEANTELAIAFAFYREAGASAHLAEAKKLLATMLPSN